MLLVVLGAGALVWWIGIALDFKLAMLPDDRNGLINLKEEWMSNFHKTYQIDGNQPNFFSRYAIGVVGLAITYLICFDPLLLLQSHIGGFYQGPNATTFLIFAAIQIYFIGSKLIKGEIVRVSISGGRLSFVYANIFNDRARTVDLDFYQVYCFDVIQANSPITLVTQQGELKLAAALQKTELVSDLNEALFLNANYYKSLTESQLYDIFNAVDSGEQYDLIHPLLNQMSEIKNQDFVKELLTPKPGLGITAQQTSHLASTEICKNCASSNVVEGSVSSTYPAYFVGRGFKYSVWRPHSSHYTLALSTLWACVDCGFFWSQFDTNRLSNHVNTHGDSTTLTRLKTRAVSQN